MPRDNQGVDATHGSRASTIAADQWPDGEAAFFRAWESGRSVAMGGALGV